jgi:GntR family transcriptional regulator, histidine utilization repressor
MARSRSTVVARSSTLSQDAAEPAPLYGRIKHHILQQIERGSWGVRERIPSENELVRLTGASRMTVNRALRELTQAGYLQRIQGVGTFVADRAHGHFLQIRNIADEIQERGHAHRAQVLELGRERVSGELAERFNLRAGSTLYRSRVLHLENELPLQLEDRYVNPAIAPAYLERDFASETPHAYLMRVAPLQQVEHVVLAAMPDAPTQQLLQMPPLEPCLVLRRRTWTGGVVASVATLAHPGSRFDLRGSFRP